MTDDVTTGARSVRTSLDDNEALALLAQASYGRLVFTKNALPATEPVNHVLDGDTVIIRCPSTVENIDGTVVTFQADSLDPHASNGWHVAITAIAEAVTDGAMLDRVQRRVPNWIQPSTTMMIALAPQLITGFSLAIPHNGGADR